MHRPTIRAWNANPHKAETPPKRGPCVRENLPERYAGSMPKLTPHHAGFWPGARWPHCQHAARLNLMQIAQQVGWETDLDAIHAALRCSECGSGGTEIRIVSSSQIS